MVSIYNWTCHLGRQQDFPSVIYTLVLNHAIGRIHGETSKVLCISDGKFTNESPIFHFASSWLHFDSKLRTSIYNGFTLGVLVVVNDHNLKSSILKNFTKIFGYKQLQQSLRESTGDVINIQPKVMKAVIAADSSHTTYMTESAKEGIDFYEIFN